MAQPNGRAPSRVPITATTASPQVSVTGRSGRAIHVQLSGSLDENSAAGLTRALQEIAPLAARPALELVLDLSRVTYLDLAGLDVLLRLQQRLLAGGGSVELLGPSISVIRMLHEADQRGSATAQSVPARPRFRAADA